MKSYLYAKEQLKKTLHNLIIREENKLDDYHLQRIKFTILFLNIPNVFKEDADNIVLKIETMIRNQNNIQINLQALSLAMIDLYTNIVQYITLQSISSYDRY